MIIRKDILIIGKGPIQGLDDTMLAAETQYPISSTRPGKKFCLSLHYNGSTSFLFVNATKIYQFKAEVVILSMAYLIKYLFQLKQKI